ncbi:MAG: hypothetical protein ACPGVP_07965 [Thiolinea sp.]
MPHISPLTILSFLFVLFLSACGGSNSDTADGEDDYEPVSFTVDGTKAIMQGTIDSRLKSTLEEMLDNNPAVTTIEMHDVPGSADDDANLVASRIIRTRGINTHVPADGIIASGGVDFYLAGLQRTLVDGAKIGVHSWADGDGRAGSDYPANDPEHKKYLDYYTEMGIPLEFYWFTLTAAPPEEIHNMTAAEITRYGVTTH